jgi:uncharacterized membrane protein
MEGGATGNTSHSPRDKRELMRQREFAVSLPFPNSALVIGRACGSVPAMTLRGDDERVKQVAIAIGILLAVACGVVLLWLGWMRVPGPLGEFLGMIVGIMSSPFFLEASFVVVGVLIVMVLNAIRRHRDGDDFVSAAQLDAREASHRREPPVPSGPAEPTPPKHP